MIRLIAAVDQKMGIAKDGSQPWKLPSDEQYFQNQTLLHGGRVLMGRTTFAVIQKPLPRRQNFVLSHATEPIEGATIVHDLQAFLVEHPDVWVIGGASVYQQTIELADELYITRIEADFDCDQFFPQIDPEIFQLKQRSEFHHENDLTFYYEIYARAS